jgi:hypothetical protein
MHSTRNGQTYISELNSIFDYTITTDYVSENTTDTTTHMVGVSEGVTTVYYDLVSGLISRTTQVQTATTIQNEGEPTVTPTNSDIYYTIELLGEAGGIKTFKHYDTSNGGTGTYTVNKIKDGITLDAKSYTDGDVLNQTATYSSPDDAIIRAKLPTLMLYSYNSVSIPASNSYQTCEVVSDSDTELVVLIKTFNSSNVLTSQYQTRCEKIAL